MDALLCDNALIDAAHSDFNRQPVAKGDMIPFFIGLGQKQVKRVRTHVDDRNLVVHGGSGKRREDTKLKAMPDGGENIGNGAHA